MVTRDEVALEAGTSSAVVSYVVNNGPRNVAPATRARVLAAIEKLDYRPNAVARSLRSSSSRVLGLIAADITNPFCGELTLAVESAALARDHSLLVGNAMYDDSRQARHLQTFIEHQVDGIVFIGSIYNEESLPPLSRAVLAGSGTPLVFLDRQASEPGGTAVLVDNRGGARMATSHLLDHGYDEVASFSGSTGLSFVRERQLGWQDALADSGLADARQRRWESPFNRYEAFAVAQTMLASDDIPRALFVHSDEQAIGIIHAASEAGVRIPEQLALVSFDDIKEASIVSPRLSTVRQPISAIGALAVDLLVSAENPGEPSRRSAVQPVSLVIRESCGCGG